MSHLADQEFEESLQFVDIAACGRGQRRRVDVAGLERSHVELEAIAVTLDAAEHAYGVPFSEAAVEQLDVVPDACVDASGGVDELEREVGRAALRPPRRCC